MNILCDIDNTICNTENSDYENSTPVQTRIDFLNKVFDKGGNVHYSTARGSRSGNNYEELTKEQLKTWGVKYTSLSFGKPDVDYIIDDKAITEKDLDFFISELQT